MTPALEVGGQFHAPAALPPEEESSVPIGYEAGWAPGAGLDDVNRRKILPLPGLELRPLGRPARCYTDCAKLTRVSKPDETTEVLKEMKNSLLEYDSVWSGRCLPKSTNCLNP
jgi:hypothetical protein